MSYYQTPTGGTYIPQQPVNPYGGMGTVGLSTPLPNTQMQQAAASAADEWATACSAIGTRWRLVARQTRFQQGRIFGDTV